MARAGEGGGVLAPAACGAGQKIAKRSLSCFHVAGVFTCEFDKTP